MYNHLEASVQRDYHSAVLHSLWTALEFRATIVMLHLRVATLLIFTVHITIIITIIGYNVP